MKPSAVMLQEANFSLIGHFGNCPLVARMASVRPVIRGRRGAGLGVFWDALDGLGRLGAAGARGYLRLRAWRRAG